jgi:hypothetical protein
MNFKKPSSVVIAVALALGVVAGLHAWRARSVIDSGVQLSARPDTVSAASRAEPLGGAEPTPASAPTGTKLEKGQAPAALFAAAMSSSDPYALAVKYRHQKGPGSFAVVSRMVATCHMAYGMTIAVLPFAQGVQSAPRGRGMPVSDEGLSPAVLASRTAASQAVAARCRPFVDDREIGQPLPDDAFGVAYQKLNQLPARVMATPDDVTRMIASLVEQGMLWDAWGELASPEGSFGYFDGRLQGGLSPEEFHRAMELGALLATAPAEGGRQDLRMLRACVYSAQCDGNLAELAVGDLPKGSESSARIKALAERIAAAFKANDLAAFKARS